MNIYDSIKFAAKNGFRIDFCPSTEHVSIQDMNGDEIAEAYWQGSDTAENTALVSPVTALIRAIRAARAATKKDLE